LRSTNGDVGCGDFLAFFSAERSGAQMSESEKGGLVSAVSQLLVVYAIYVFISGWAFLDYYFRYFGLDTRWLDLSTPEVLIKGFTILFSEGWWVLWPIYGLLFSVPLIVERKLQNRFNIALAVVMFLLCMLFPIYIESRSIGEKMAVADKGVNSTLPAVTFTAKISKLQYHGKLLGFRSGTYFVHNVELIPGQNVKTTDVFTGSPLELSIIRAEDVVDVSVIEHK
jgi:hypothetical protein